MLLCKLNIRVKPLSDSLHLSCTTSTIIDLMWKRHYWDEMVYYNPLEVCLLEINKSIGHIKNTINANQWPRKDSLEGLEHMEPIQQRKSNSGETISTQSEHGIDSNDNSIYNLVIVASFHIQRQEVAIAHRDIAAAQSSLCRE